MKQFLTYLFIALFALLVVSCKKDKNENENEKVQLVKTIRYYRTNDDPGVAEYTDLHIEYDDKNRIKTMSAISADTEVSTFIYNGDDLVMFKSGNITLNFSKNGSKITVLSEEDNIDREIELNSNGYPIKSSWSNNAEWFFQYLDGNVQSLSIGGTSFIYEYDNKKSPFYYCRTPKWFPVFNLTITQVPFILPYSYCIKNNITDYISSCDDKNKQEWITYEYDNNGFPTKMYWDGKLYATFTY